MLERELVQEFGIMVRVLAITRLLITKYTYPPPTNNAVIWFHRLNIPPMDGAHIDLWCTQVYNNPSELEGFPLGLLNPDRRNVSLSQKYPLITLSSTNHVKSAEDVKESALCSKSNIMHR